MLHPAALSPTENTKASVKVTELYSLANSLFHILKGSEREREEKKHTEFL